MSNFPQDPNASYMYNESGENITLARIQEPEPPDQQVSASAPSASTRATIHHFVERIPTTEMQPIHRQSFESNDHFPHREFDTTSASHPPVATRRVIHLDANNRVIDESFVTEPVVQEGSMTPRGGSSYGDRSIKVTSPLEQFQNQPSSEYLSAPVSANRPHSQFSRSRDSVASAYSGYSSAYSTNPGNWRSRDAHYSPTSYASQTIPTSSSQAQRATSVDSPLIISSPAIEAARNQPAYTPLSPSQANASAAAQANGEPLPNSQQNAQQPIDPNAAANDSPPDTSVGRFLWRLKKFEERHRRLFYFIQAVGDFGYIIGSLIFIIGCTLLIVEQSQTTQSITAVMFTIGSSCFFVGNIIKFVSEFSRGIVTKKIMHSLITVFRCIASLVVLCASVLFMSGSIILFVTTLNLMDWEPVDWSTASSVTYLIGTIGFFIGILISGTAMCIEFFEVSPNDSFELKAHMWCAFIGTVLHYSGSIFFLLGGAVSFFHDERDWDVFANAMWVVGSALFFVGPFFILVSEVHMCAGFRRMKKKSLESLDIRNPLPSGFRTHKTSKEARRSMSSAMTPAPPNRLNGGVNVDQRNYGV